MKKDDLVVQKWRRCVAAGSSGGGAGSLSVLWSAAKMAAGIIMIIMKPSINPTIVRKDATMTWLTVTILTRSMNGSINET